MHQLNPSHARTSKSGLTEIVLADARSESFKIIMPMLAHLSQSSGDRWLTWIAPRGESNKLDTEYFAFAKDHVRLVHTVDEEQSLWILWEALSNGTSATVVATLSGISERDRFKLEQAAEMGNSRGLILRHR